MAVCSIDNTKCTVKIRYNIVAAATWSGYTVMGHKCGDYTSKNFYKNVAHSIAGFGGHGALFYPDSFDNS